MTARDWVSLVGTLITVAGVVFGAWRAGKSSDRAQKVALKTKREEYEAAANSAENSAFTRAQEMIEAAAATQQRTFDAAMARMEQQIRDLQAQVDSQAEKLAAQHEEIVALQRGRENDRRQYIRYIEKLLALLKSHGIPYEPPPFFDENS